MNSLMPKHASKMMAAVAVKDGRMVADERRCVSLRVSNRRASLIVCKDNNGSARSVSAESSNKALSSPIASGRNNIQNGALTSSDWQGAKRASFSSIDEAISELKKGRIVLLIDPKSSEDVGTFITAGSLASEETMAFMVNHGSGLIMCPADPAVLDRLELPVMMKDDPWSVHRPIPYAMTVDLLEGTTTGISASDRALTIRRIAASESKPEDFRKPGHVIPVRSSPGGSVQHAGHAEAAVDLARMAGLPPVAAMCAISNDDGTMGQLVDAQRLSKLHGFCIVSIPEVVRHRKLTEKVAERTAVARLPTQWGDFQILSYTSLLDGIEHVALVKGDLSNGEDVLCRVHSECLTGDIFASARCDCGPQLHQAMQRISTSGRGVLIYLRGQEGRGIGIGKKLEAYNLQDRGRDTVEANQDLGLPVDAREYGVSADILRDLGVSSVRLMTNNPAKFEALRSYGINVKSRVPVLCPITLENKKYLETKREKMGHLYASDISGLFGKLPTEMEDSQ